MRTIKTESEVIEQVTITTYLTAVKPGLQLIRVEIKDNLLNEVTATEYYKRSSEDGELTPIAEDYYKLFVNLKTMLNDVFGMRLCRNNNNRLN